MRPVSVGKNLTANTLTTLFTVPTRNIATARDVLMTNRGVGNKHISIYWYDKRTITSKTSQTIDSNFQFVLDEGDELRSISEAGSTMTVVATFELEATSAVQYTQY